MEKRAYEVRVCKVEHSPFTPLVFAATGEMSHDAFTFYTIKQGIFEGN